MNSSFQKFLEVLIRLGILTLFFVSGLAMMAIDKELTGFLLLVVFFGLIIYFPLTFQFKRNGYVSDLQSRKVKETWWATLVAGFICLVGAIESYAEYEQLTILFSIILIGTLIGGYLRYRNIVSKDELYNHKIIPFLKLAFGIGAGFILLALEDGDYEPIFSFGAFIYVLVIGYWIVSWLIWQIKLVLSLKNEKARTELLHLQSQVNPHFFFNMLNNLYGLVEIDSKKAQALILKLSEMMRYSIYEGQKDMVTMEEEIEYLKNYIELHKMRYHKKIEIRFNCDIQESTIKVMPLLFIILLENAFKHGIEKLRKNAYVNVDLKTNGTEITFNIENNFDINKSPSSVGIGLENLKRRLELAYTEKHSLSISTSGNIYKAQLSLKPI